MITISSYNQDTRNIDWVTMPEALAKGHKLTQGASADNWNAYHKSDTIKRVVDAYMQKLDEYLQKNKASTSSKSLPVKAKTEGKKNKPAPAPVSRKSNYKGLKVEIRPASAISSKYIIWDLKSDQKFANEKFDTVEQAKEFVDENEMFLVDIKTNDQPDSSAEVVEHIDTDVQFIQRYAAMHGKVKTQAQILSLLHSLQKAILERRINKSSPYAKEIGLMQDQLIRVYEKMGEVAEIKIDAKNLKRYLEIAGMQEKMLSITLLKAYVALNGKRGIKDKAESLKNRIRKAVDSGKITKSDKYAQKLNDAYKALAAYLEGDKETLTINRTELNGLMGIDGEDLFGQKNSLNGVDDESGPTIVASGELLGMEFKTIGLQGKYRDLIGDPSVGFSAMVYGLPKSGKSTMCLDFAKHLAENHGKVLYCAIEEGFGYTLKEKIERLRASHPNLYITDRIPSDLDNYQFVFIDSVSKAGMEVPDMEQLRKDNPETSFIFIYHTTKEGRFKGVNTHAHEVDVIIEVGKGEAKATGRFNTGGCISK